MFTVPILTFHALDSRSEPISYPVALFEYLIGQLYAAGFQTMTLVRWCDVVERGETPASKTVVLTFDDGYQSVYDAAHPLLQRFGMVATVFVTTAPLCSEDSPRGEMNARPLMSVAELHTLDAAGWEIAAHTHTHPDLTRLSDQQAHDELGGSQARLEQLFGKRVETFAYPFGRYGKAARRIAAQHFRCAVSDRLALTRPEDDRYALPRLDAYYFRSRAAVGWLFSPWLRAYVTARAVPRNLRRAVMR